jgi:hypothetical protein
MDEWPLHHRRFCHGDSQQVVPFSLQLHHRRLPAAFIGITPIAKG